MILYFLLLILFHNFCRCYGFDGKTDQTRIPLSDTHAVTSESDDDQDECKDNNSLKNCTDLNYICMKCNDYNLSCVYGKLYNITCEVPEAINCVGDRIFNKIAKCQFCWQTEKWKYVCAQKFNCIAVSSPIQYYKTNCTVNNDVICLGNRRFTKKVKCNWTRGHKWSTALLLSITLGGFGADRFYLGHWQEGIGKLFSFGGLGVWTLVDVLLISIRYLGPADGSFYT